MVCLGDSDSQDRIRSACRIMTFATKWDGPVNTNEKFFYCLGAWVLYVLIDEAGLMAVFLRQQFSYGSSQQDMEYLEIGSSRNIIASQKMGLRGRSEL